MLFNTRYKRTIWITSHKANMQKCMNTVGRHSYIKKKCCNLATLSACSKDKIVLQIAIVAKLHHLIEI